MVAADAGMYVPEELAPLGDGHASLQDAKGGKLVQLAVDKGERFGHPGDAPGLRPVRGEFSSVHPSDVFVAPVHPTGGRLDIHDFGLVGVVPLEEGEHVRLIRGVLVHGLWAFWIRGSPRGFRVVRGVWLEGDGRLGDIPSEDVRGTVICPDAILPNSSASSLYRRGT
jgi:hypothetical protein